MRKSKFEQSLDAILVEANNQDTMDKVASLDADIEELNGDVAKSLTKIASILRRTSTEPTYQDMIDFIGGN
jgi:hypothetical protein